MNKTIKVNTRHHPRKKLLKQITKTYNKFFFNSSRVSFLSTQKPKKQIEIIGHVNSPALEKGKCAWDGRALIS